MFLIFGTQGVKRKNTEESILAGKCPNCRSGDLEPKTYRNWFALFFIPIFPISSGRNIYECNQCRSTYNEEIQDYVKDDRKQDNKEQTIDVRLIVSRAVIACLTYMVKTESGNTSKTIYEVDKLIFKKPDLSQELDSIKSSILQLGNAENQVFEYLYEAKDLLSKDDLWQIFIQIKEFLSNQELNSENQISQIQEFLIATGFPKNRYKELIQSSRN